MSTHVRAYRPDIDGLRAVAVLSVFLYHLGIPGFGGGFVGVDVFFVISGYLISRILVDEHDTRGRIDLAAFYLRRIRRIVPALVAVLTATTVAAVVLLSPILLIEYAQSMLSALGSVANLFFAEKSGYFDGDATLKPLLHTWSLGVEEQFYLVWPLCVAGMSRWPKYRTAGIVVLCVLSTALAAYWVTVDPTNAFYQMPFRVGEFALGAIITALPAPRALPRWGATLLAAMGLLAVVGAVCWYSDATLFPGLAALLPCVGAALWIWAAPDAVTVPWLLTNRVMVQIGLWSYVIYLVHWPVIVYAPYVRNFQAATMWDTLSIVVTTFAIAAVIHITIERPLRSPAYPLRRFGWVIASSVFLLSAAGAGMWVSQGWQSRAWVNHGSLTPAAIAAGQNARFQINALMCERRQLDCSPPTDGKPRIIIENPPADEQSVLVIGDSHAVDAMNALYPVLPAYDFYLSQLGACPPRADIATVLGKRFANLQQCMQLTEKRFDPTYLRQFDVVAINVLFVRYGVRELDAYLNFLQQNGIKRVIVFGNFVTLTRDMGEIVDQYGYSPAAVELFRSDNPRLDRALARSAAAHGFFYISKYATFCPDDACTWFDAAHVPFSYDKSHLSFEYASRLALPYADAIRAYVSEQP